MQVSERALKGPASGIRKMFELARRYDHVINLCIGEPGFQTPDFIISAGCEALHKGHTKYTSNAGVLELREALSEKLLRDNDIKVNPETQIVVTTGAGEAILIALLTLVNPGDEVIIPNPCWPNYYGHIGIAGGVAVTADTYEENEFKLTAEAVAAALSPKTKVIIVNSPSNPTGAVMDSSELIKIGELAKAHDIVVISDEPYEKLIYDGKNHFSLGSVDSLNDHVITVNSFSKTYAMTGWRVGYAAGPEHFVGAMVKLQESISSCVNASAQQACISALKGSQEDVQNMLSTYKERRDLLVTGLNALPGFKCLVPAGAFYAFVNIKELHMTSEEAAEYILKETQVVTTPGSAFGTRGEGYLRLSFASSTEDIQEALLRLESSISRK